MRSFFRSLFQRITNPNRLRSRFLPLRLEVLEDRCLLSGSGTLSGALSDNNLYSAIAFNGSISGGLSGTFTGAGDYVFDTKDGGGGGSFSGSGSIGTNTFTSGGSYGFGSYTFSFGVGDAFSGSFGFNGNASNGDNVSGSGTFSGTYDSNFSVTAGTFSGSIADNPISLTNPGTQSNTEGDTASLALIASDTISGATLNYSATGLPNGLSINRTTGVISGTVGAGGTYQSSVTASDGTNANTQTFTWNVSSPVSITSPGNQSNTEGDSVSLGISASDSDTGTLSFSAQQLPPGLTIKPSTGVISGTVAPGDAQFGTYPTTVTVSDGINSNSLTFNWSIQSPISFTNPGPQNSMEGDSISLAVSATDSTSAALTYTALGLPPGLTINPSTGVIDGTIAVGSSAADSYPLSVTASDGTYTASQQFNWFVTDPITLTPPSNQTTSESDTVSLSIMATDSTSATLTYAAIDLPPGLTINPSTGVISGTVATGDSVNGFYYPTVTASDDTYSAAAGFNWTINSPITVTSPANQTGAESDTVSLSISASDSRSLSLTYAAFSLPEGLTINPSSGVISGTLTAGAAAFGPYTTTVTASDGTDFGSATFTWTVSSYVTLTDPGNQTSTAGNSVSLTLAASDAGADTFAYSVVNLPAGLSLNTTTGVISGDASIGAIADSPYLTTVTATDGDYSTSQTFWWTVNSPITITAPNSAQHNDTGDSVSLQIAATDSTSATLTYSATNLPVGLSLNTSTGLISGPLTAGGVYQTVLTASDGTYTASQALRWTVTSVGPVTLFNPGSQFDWTGDAVSFPLSATDANGSATLSYSATGLPVGLSLNSSTGVIFGNISAGDAAGSPYTVVVTASDGTYSATQTFSWAVSSTGAITLLNPGYQSGAEGTSVSLTLSGSDTVSGSTVTYSTTDLPTGLSLNSSSGAISGTLTAGGWYYVTVTASDGTNSASQAFLWNVTSTGTVSLTNPGTQFNYESDSVTLTLQGSDTISGSTLSYSATSLPSGLSINSSTGVISGTISAGDYASSPYTTTVTASDGTYSDSQTFVWTIDTPISLKNPGNQGSQEGDSVWLYIKGVDLNGGNMTYSVSGLPAGLSLLTTTSDDTGLIFGTIYSGDAADGPYSITVGATDGKASDSITFNWTVAPPGSLTLNNPGTQTYSQGAAVSLTLTDSYSGTGSVSFSAVSLPSGLSLNPNSGVISGTLSPMVAGDSSYRTTVTASDGTSSDSQTFIWAINKAVTLTAPSSETTSVGGSVSVTLTATDATGGTLTYSADGLASGLTINPSTGTITGTVVYATSGTNTWMVWVTASDGTYSDTQVINWTLINSLTFTPPGNQRTTEGTSVSLQMSASQGAGTSPLRYSAVGLPPGLSLNAYSGLISGTVPPGAAAQGPYQVTVTVTITGDAVSQTFWWTVSSPITLTNPGKQNSHVGDPVSLQLQATVSPSATLTYSATGLPPGLSINPSTGLISGTITNPVGLFGITITASDSTSSTSQFFWWRVTTPTAFVPPPLGPNPPPTEAGPTHPLGYWYDLIPGIQPFQILYHGGDYIHEWYRGHQIDAQQDEVNWKLHDRRDIVADAGNVNGPWNGASGSGWWNANNALLNPNFNRNWNQMLDDAALGANIVVTWTASGFSFVSPSNGVKYIFQSGSNKFVNAGTGAEVSAEEEAVLWKQFLCFPAGTLVSTEVGQRPIETIKAGDRVWSYDIVSSQWRLCRVQQTSCRYYEGLSVLVTVAGDFIEATFLHPFWVVRGEQLDQRPRRKDMETVPTDASTPGRWVDAGHLRVGDELLLRDGRIMPVEALRIVQLHEEVYNFELDAIHTYAVGLNEILVHNGNGDPYQTALAGGKHAGLLQRYAGASQQQIEKGIASLMANSQKHAAYAADPAQYAANWATMTSQEQAGLIRYWLKEAVNYAEQAAVLRGLL